VNADAPEDVDFVFREAARYRQKFNLDVVIDLIGYRKMGHNELDQPSFTQPLMYKQVNKMVPVVEKYEQQLIDEGVLTTDVAVQMKEKVMEIFEGAYLKSKQHTFTSEEWETPQWEEIKTLN
jgi:2-oxoglutarate dehydrogenase E1 component